MFCRNTTIYEQMHLIMFVKPMPEFPYITRAVPRQHARLFGNLSLKEKQTKLGTAEI